MPARSIERPSDTPLTSSAEVMQWLEFLCLNSSCRGLGGHELADSPIAPLASNKLGLGHDGASNIREFLRAKYARKPGEPTSGFDVSTAKLHLIGLTPSTEVQGRALRRELAANAMAQSTDSFQKRDERLLLADVAADIWAAFG